MSESITYPDRTGTSARVAFSRQGRGTPLVLIHGVGLRSGVWAPQIDALCTRHDVVAMDMPGHGGSTLPPEDASLADYSQAVLSLLDGLGIPKACVVGHSMGALVALDFALAHPDRVLGVVAMNAVFCRTPEQSRAVMARVGAVDDASGPPDWSGTLERWFGNPVPAHLRGTAMSVRDLLDGIDPIGYARTYRLFATSDAAHRDRLRELAVPALFLTGEGDHNSSPTMSRAMAALAPHGRAEAIPGERHMMALTAPDQVTSRLAAFLDEVDGHPTEAPPPSSTPLDPKAFRRALGSFPTGIAVVATTEADGTPRGFTANSFTSVSLDPPLILVCIAKTASSCPVFSSAEYFSVNVLADHQADVSSLFATKLVDKFARAAWRRGATGSPLLDEVSAWFDCRRERLIEAGDHVILVGEVIQFDQAPATPLGYCRGTHVSFGLDVDALAASGGRTRIGAIVERDRALLMLSDERGGLDLPWASSLGVASEGASLNGRLGALGIGADLDFLFAVFDDPARGAGAMSVVYRGTMRDPPPSSSTAFLVPLDELPWEKVADAAVRVMLRRYIAERAEDLFGIYVGDAERGTVQRLAGTPEDPAQRGSIR